MGALKKSIRANVRRAARLVIDNYYQETRSVHLKKARLNSLVKLAEKKTVPLIMTALRAGGRQPGDNISK